LKKKGLFNRITQSIQTKLRNPMDKWPNRNWWCLLSQFLYIFIATSCSNIKLPNFIPTQADNQVRLLNEKSKEKKITEFRTILNKLDELKIKIENKNNQIFFLERELDRIKYLNNSQTNQISHLQFELDQTKNIKQIKENEITRLKEKLDQTTNSRQTQEIEITRLKNKLDQIIKLEQARALEKIEESSFFEP